MSGAETWQMRGIIPRALTFLFDELEKRTDLEKETIADVRRILQEEFDKGE